MDKLILVFQKMPMGALAFIFLITMFFIYFIMYIYVCINIKGICKITFGDEKKYKLPLEPFDFIYISFIPTTFWRELLHLKKGIEFKSLYKKDFFLKMKQGQLESLLKSFPILFILQYVAIFFGILFMLLMLMSYCFELG